VNIVAMLKQNNALNAMMIATMMKTATTKRMTIGVKSYLRKRQEKNY